MDGETYKVQPSNGAHEMDFRRVKPQECEGKLHFSPASLFFLLLVIALLSAGAVALVAYLTGGWTTGGEMAAQTKAHHIPGVSEPEVEPESDSATAEHAPESEAEPDAEAESKAGGKHGTSAAESEPESEAEPESETEAEPVAEAEAEDSFRLPTTLKPSEYKINMQVFMPYESVSFAPERNFTYEMQLEVAIDCLEDTSTVTLHQIDLTIDKDSVHLSQADGWKRSIAKPETIAYRKHVEMVDFVFPIKMKAGMKYVLKMDLSGSIPASRNDGFYLSTYNENGVVKYLAATDLEPTACRRIFPQFDEPQLKAVYKLTVVYPRGLHALSNAHALSEQRPVGNGWMKTKFEQSPLMSSYLFAVAISEFKSIEKMTSRGVQVRVWSRPESVDKLDFSLDIAVKCVDFLEAYFDMDYVLDKLDLIALPDFTGGAMENWGLITFREVFLTRDAESSNDVGYASTAGIIAHEIAHMWFGNTVTMKWWDDLWLNEAFATYMVGVVIDPITDNRFHNEDRSVSNLKRALANDALPGTHPVIVDGLAKSDDILRVFYQTSFIPYDKGSYLLRMLHKVVGEDVMRAGLTSYLRKYKFSNAEHSDLWNSLTEAVTMSANSGSFNVKMFMETWTRQMNYPVVIVDRDSKGAVSVRQERFRTDPSQPDPEQFKVSPFGYKWQIPLWHIQETSEEEALDWLQPTNETVMLNAQLSGDEWILLNSGWKGYYRVQYSAELLQALSNQLQRNHMVIPMRNRAQLLDDAFALANAGRLDFEAALELTTYLKDEEHSIVWTTAFQKLTIINNLFMTTPAYGDFLKYMRKLIDPIYQQYAWRDDLLDGDILQITLVRDASTYACASGHKACLRQAHAHIADIMHSCSAIDAALGSDCNRFHSILRSRTYCIAVSSSDAKIWEFMWEKYKLEEDPTEKIRLMYALTCTQEPWLVQRMLTEATFGTEIRLGMIRYVFGWLSRHANGRLGLWKFFQDNFDRLFEKYGQVSNVFGHIVRRSMTMTNTNGDVEQLKRFYAAHPQLKPYKAIIDRQIAFNQVGSAWLEKNYESLEKWFSDQSLDN